MIVAPHPRNLPGLLSHLTMHDGLGYAKNGSLAWGKSQAIEHNRALCKAQPFATQASLRDSAASRPSGSPNGRLCLAPRPVMSASASLMLRET